MFKGFLISYSIKDEPKEIFLDKPKIKRYGREDVIEGEENAGLLISGSKIKRIIVPERSFRKHFEPMGHISQAFYWIILAIGFFFLSWSAHLTGNYMSNLKLPSVSLASLESFYYGLLLFFLVSTIVVLCFSVWVAQKDFDSWGSFFRLSPDIAFMAIFFSLLPMLLILLIMHISLILILIFVFLYIFLLPLLYLYKIRNWLRKPIKDSFDRIKSDFNDDQDFKKVIRRCYLQLSCNDKSKAHISDIAAEIYENDEHVRRWLASDDENERRRLEENYENARKVSRLIAEIEGLKDCREYLENEDFNIIVAFKYFIKKEDC